jgi:hypothetical protein
MKEAYYFPHDYNARNDLKMERLIQAQGMEGVGLFWCLVEMLYEEGGELKRIDLPIIARKLHIHIKTLDKVLENYGLSEKVWSNSVKVRLNLRKAKTESARLSALSRWNDDANAMRTQCDGNAIKERKGKEIKESNKEKYGEFQNVLLSPEEHGKLVERLGEVESADLIERLSTYMVSKKKKYESHYATLLTWARDDNKKVSQADTTGKKWKDVTGNHV